MKPGSMSVPTVLAVTLLFFYSHTSVADEGEYEDEDSVEQGAPAQSLGDGVKSLFGAIGNLGKATVDTIGGVAGGGTSSQTAPDQPPADSVSSSPSNAATTANASSSARMDRQVQARAGAPKAAEVPPVHIPFNANMPMVNVVVSPVQVGVGEIPQVVGASITAQMLTALTRVENLTVIDREASKAIAAELQLSQTSMVAEKDKLRGVNLPIAQYIIRGVVTEFNQFAKGAEDGTELELGVIGDILSVAGNDRLGTIISLANPTMGDKTKWITGMVKIDIKIIDVRRATIVEVIESAGAFTSLVKGSHFGLFGMKKSQKQFSKSVVGQATRAAVNDAAKKIYAVMKKRSGKSSRVQAKNSPRKTPRASTSAKTIASSDLGPEESYQLGLMAQKKAKYKKAARWYQASAKGGSAEGQYALGNLYREGQGVRKDQTQAVQWYQRSAKQGHAAAQFNLGLMYGFGYGVKENQREARKWWQLAAAQGHSKAKRFLAESK